MKIERGDILIAKLDPVIGSEQGSTRPVVVIQNNVGNKTSPTIIIAAITSKVFNKEYITNVDILKKESGLNHDSTILLNQIKTIDKTRIIKKISNLDQFTMRKVNLAIKVSLGLN